MDSAKYNPYGRDLMDAARILGVCLDDIAPIPSIPAITLDNLLADDNPAE